MSEWVSVLVNGWGGCEIHTVETLFGHVLAGAMFISNAELSTSFSFFLFFFWKFLGFGTWFSEIFTLNFILKKNYNIIRRTWDVLINGITCILNISINSSFQIIFESLNQSNRKNIKKNILT